MKYQLLAMLCLGIQGCSHIKINFDNEHYYKQVDSFYEEEMPRYYVSMEKEGSHLLLNDRITSLNAVSKATNRSIDSICIEADRDGDHVIDSKEFTSFMKGVGKFETIMY